MSTVPLRHGNVSLLRLQAVDAPQHDEPDRDNQQLWKADFVKFNVEWHRPQVDAVPRELVPALPFVEMIGILLMVLAGAIGAFVGGGSAALFRRAGRTPIIDTARRLDAR